MQNAFFNISISLHNCNTLTSGVNPSIDNIFANIIN